jgi:hypothetical protein
MRGIITVVLMYIEDSAPCGVAMPWQLPGLIGISTLPLAVTDHEYDATRIFDCFLGRGSVRATDVLEHYYRCRIDVPVGLDAVLRGGRCTVYCHQH